MTDSNATELLRKLLGERGVEHINKDLDWLNDFHDTRWQALGVQWCYTEYEDTGHCYFKACNEMKNITPEQAIAATLGAGECEMETDWDYLQNGIPDAPEDTWAYMCSACEWSFRYDRGIKPSYCPNCGKAVS